MKKGKKEALKKFKEDEHLFEEELPTHSKNSFVQINTRKYLQASIEEKASRLSAVMNTMASSAIRIALGFAEIRDSELFLAAGCKSMEDFSSKFLRYGSNETNSILDVYSLVVSNEQNYEFLASASLNNLIRLADSLKVKETKYIGCGLVITPDGKRREYKEFMQEVESNEEEVKRITEEKEELERKLLDSEGNIETLQRQNYEMRNKVEEFIQNSSTSGNAIKILDHGQNMINAAVKKILSIPEMERSQDLVPTIEFILSTLDTAYKKISDQYDIQITAHALSTGRPIRDIQVETTVASTDQEIVQKRVQIEGPKKKKGKKS